MAKSIKLVLISTLILLTNCSEAVLTMYHWDTPQACEDQYGSWSSDQIISDFTVYADVLFQNFGDRVKLWLTIYEPAAVLWACVWSSFRSMGLVSKSISNRLSRQRFFSGVTAALKDAIIMDKVPITSFIAWSLLDNFFLSF